MRAMTRRLLLGGVAGTAGLGAAGRVRAEAACGPPLLPVAPVNERVAARHGPEYTTMPVAATGVDVESLMQVRGRADLAAVRARMIGYVWKNGRLPSGLPRVRRGAGVPSLTGLPGVARIDELAVPLRYGVTSRVYHLLPRRPWNGRLALYHNGHGEPPEAMVRTVGALVARGYAVLVFAMPFMHWNAQPIADPRDARTRHRIEGHDDLARWESAGFATLTFFLEPVAVALNHAMRGRPSSVEMVGLSGGGWTTTVYAALDPRITRSYPVAGSLPFHLRGSAPNARSSLGDWEQRRDTLPGFYGTTDYLDLYVMAAAGPRRRQLQVLNRFDACCFAGVGHRSYVAAVTARAALAGGRWGLLEDATHDRHTISPYALAAILADLGA